MNNDDLQQLLKQARSSQERLDWAAATYGFETRLTARLADLNGRPPGTVYLLWRAVAGCAAFVGLLAVWFILAQAPREAEDDLTTFWGGGQAGFDTELLN